MRLMQDNELYEYVRNNFDELVGKEVNVMSYNKKQAKEGSLCFYRDMVLAGGAMIIHRWCLHYPFRVKVRRATDSEYVTVYFRTFTSSKNCNAKSSKFFVPGDVYDRVRKRFDLSFSEMDNDDDVALSWFVQNVYFRRVKKPRRKKYTMDEIDAFLDSFSIY